MKLNREFYCHEGLLVAKDLIGKQLVHKSQEGTTKGIIVETEAYMGPKDPASHSYKGLTPRTAIQYGEGGFAYIYSIYGLHTCMNVVANIAEYPEAVLIRALQPTFGIDLMKERRQQEKEIQLCSGPGKLCQAMGITKKHYGIDLCGDQLFIESVDETVPPAVSTTKRINIDYAGDAANWLWRFVLKDSQFISVPPRH